MKTTTKHNPFIQSTVRSSEASRVEALLRIPGDPAAAERLCAAAVLQCRADPNTDTWLDVWEAFVDAAEAYAATVPTAAKVKKHGKKGAKG